MLLHRTREDAGVSIDAIRGSIRMAGEVDLLLIMRKVQRGALEVNIDGRELVRPDLEDGNLCITYDEPPRQEIGGGWARRPNRQSVGGCKKPRVTGNCDGTPTDRQPKSRSSWRFRAGLDRRPLVGGRAGAQIGRLPAALGVPFQPAGWRAS